MPSHAGIELRACSSRGGRPNDLANEAVREREREREREGEGVEGKRETDRQRGGGGGVLFMVNQQSLFHAHNYLPGLKDMLPH